MKATNLFEAAAPLLRGLLPAEVNDRRVPLGYTLTLYKDVIRQRLSIEVFERQFNRLLHLPATDDPQNLALAMMFDRRLVNMNSALHSGSSIDENHAPTTFNKSFAPQLQADMKAFLPRYTTYMNDMLDNYERLKRQQIDFYPFQAPDLLGKAFVILRNIETYNSLAIADRDPRRTFNEKTRKYYTTLFNLTGTFLNL